MKNYVVLFVVSVKKFKNLKYHTSSNIIHYLLTNNYSKCKKEESISSYLNKKNQLRY